MDIITRDAALALGRKHFYTGKPCVHGHLLPRYVVSGSCTKCSSPTWRNIYRQTGGGMLRIFVPIPPDMGQSAREALELYIVGSCVPVFLASLKK
jgi:hypothetical protein